MTTSISASSPAIQVVVRRMRAEDWQHARCIRLAALADAPEAYGRTLADELTTTDADWQDIAARNAAGEQSCGFLAWAGDVPCGTVLAVLTHPDEVDLYAMWVAQNIRRRGTGLALVQAVCAWARERGAKRVSLKVVATNHGAIALYLAQGFEPIAENATCGARQAPALRMVKRLL